MSGTRSGTNHLRTRIPRGPRESNPSAVGGSQLPNRSARPSNAGDARDKADNGRRSRDHVTRKNIFVLARRGRGIDLAARRARSTRARPFRGAGALLAVSSRWWDLNPTTPVRHTGVSPTTLHLLGGLSRDLVGGAAWRRRRGRGSLRPSPRSRTWISRFSAERTHHCAKEGFRCLARHLIVIALRLSESTAVREAHRGRPHARRDGERTIHEHQIEITYLDLISAKPDCIDHHRCRAATPLRQVRRQGQCGCGRVRIASAETTEGHLGCSRVALASLAR